MNDELNLRIERLIGSLKSISPASETSTDLYPIEEFEEGNTLFIISTSSTTKGGLDDDICEIEERNSSNENIRKYLYWSLGDLSGNVSGGYKIL